MGVRTSVCGFRMLKIGKITYILRAPDFGASQRLGV